MIEMIQIYCEKSEDIQGIMNHLERLPVNANARLKVRSFDSISPDIIVTGTNVLITIIGGIFSYIRAKHAKIIHIKGSDGFEVTVPADIPPDQLDRLIEKASAKGANRIIITSKD